jgi:TonB-dependent receptor
MIVLESSFQNRTLKKSGEISMENKKHKHQRQPKSKLHPFVMTALAIAVSNVWADDTVVNNNVATTLDAVVVTGKALSIQKSIAEKRYQSVISDGVSADEVGSIPDFGLGEAVQRISGVSMLQNNNRGEAQFMTIRGLNPDYNTTLVDGVALPATETTRETVSLDILPSSLPRQVTIYKTLTPEMDSNAIGGIADLRTRSAFDTNKLFASVKADAADWENKREVFGNKKPSGQIEGVVSNVFGPDDQFGFVLSGNPRPPEVMV